MPNNDTNIKKIYNETASVVTKLCFDKKISEKEMYFLLNLLDFIWLENGSDELIKSIVEWQEVNSASELDEIIKETLLTIDFTSEESIKQMAYKIQDLLLYINR